MTDSPLNSLPSNFSFKIRPGQFSDVPAISKAYAQAWRETYQGTAPPAFVDGMTEAAAAGLFQESFRPNRYCYFLYVAEVEGRIVGFADGGKERSRPESGEGELYAIYLLREFQGKGVGRELFRASLVQLNRSELSPVVVWVLEENPHRKFYESLGGTLGLDRKKLKVQEAGITLIPYRWTLSAKK
ncbi:MAG: GNAT family N-acetyltransferase [bacterium]